MRPDLSVSSVARNVHSPLGGSFITWTSTWHETSIHLLPCCQTHLLSTENWHVKWAVAEPALQNLTKEAIRAIKTDGDSSEPTWSLPSTRIRSLPRWLEAPFLIFTEVLFLIHFSLAWFGTKCWRWGSLARADGWLSGNKNRKIFHHYRENKLKVPTCLSDLSQNERYHVRGLPET